jgi:hypothetical protein
LLYRGSSPFTHYATSATAHRHRTANRGGGVGFYIKNAITFKLVAELSTFIDNVFETITIEAKVHNKTYMLSSVYRSPNPPANMSTNIQLTSFNSHLDTLLARLNALKLNSYIFLDSNLNLLHISTDNNAANYHDLITSNGYLQTITRATRIQHNNFSLIDHILTNSPSTKSQSGILISDISDHFFTFTLPDYQKKHSAPASYTTRDFSNANIQSFRNTLRNITWQSTFNSDNADDSYNSFWTDFKQAYDTHFPKVTRRTSKNKHKICNFLTQELLQARNTKIELHKKYLANPTTESKAAYTKFRNEYNTAIRKRKAQYYEQSLAASNSSKKAWEILKEAASLNKSSHRITEIIANGTPTTNSTEIANTFNNFFSTVGTKIASSLPNSDVDPLSYCPDLPDTVRHLELEGCGPMLVGNTIKNLVSKNSTDIDGISSKLLKAISYEIERPLAL